jgi:hypothetical protein
VARNNFTDAALFKVTQVVSAHLHCSEQQSADELSWTFSQFLSLNIRGIIIRVPLFATSTLLLS